MEVKIYTIHFNKIEYLKFQYDLLLKFCSDNFQYIVINNGVNINCIEEISEFCKINNIEEIRTPHLFDFKGRILYKAQDHARVLKYIYDTFIQYDNSKLRVIMDSDIFPFKKFSFFDLIDNCQIAGISMEQPYRYISSFVSIFGNEVNLSNIPILTEENKDSGLWTKEYVEKYKTKWLKHTAPIRDKEITYIFKNSNLKLPNNQHFMFIESCLIHYWQGSGWLLEPLEYHNKKFEYIRYLIENINLYDLCLDNKVQYENAIMDEWIRKDIYPLNQIV